MQQTTFLGYIVLQLFCIYDLCYIFIIIIITTTNTTVAAATLLLISSSVLSWFVNTREHHSAYLIFIVIVISNVQDVLTVLSVYIPYFATNLIDTDDIKEIPINSL